MDWKCAPSEGRSLSSHLLQTSRVGGGTVLCLSSIFFEETSSSGLDAYSIMDCQVQLCCIELQEESINTLGLSKICAGRERAKAHLFWVWEEFHTTAHWNGLFLIRITFWDVWGYYEVLFYCTRVVLLCV